MSRQAVCPTMGRRTKEEEQDLCSKRSQRTSARSTEQSQGGNSFICLTTLPQSIALYLVLGQALEDQDKRVHRAADKTPTLAARREQHIPVNSSCKSFNMLHTQHE